LGPRSTWRLPRNCRVVFCFAEYKSVGRQFETKNEKIMNDRKGRRAASTRKPVRRRANGEDLPGAPAVARLRSMTQPARWLVTENFAIHTGRKLLTARGGPVLM